jgi:hypothetical protein
MGNQVDLNVLSYDPRDHFDFAYIDESWKRINKRLESGTINDFGCAVHALGDFYAHSMYAYFAKRKDADHIELYDPDKPVFAKPLVYDFSGLSMPDASLTPEKAAEFWKGKLISGQWWRWYTTYPDDIQNKKELRIRRNLPDHDVLAVDAEKPEHDDNYFVLNRIYDEQFKLRRNAAIEHVRKTYTDWKKQHKGS